MTLPLTREQKLKINEASSRYNTSVEFVTQGEHLNAMRLKDERIKELESKLRKFDLLTSKNNER